MPTPLPAASPSPLLPLSPRSIILSALAPHRLNVQPHLPAHNQGLTNPETGSAVVVGSGVRGMSCGTWVWHLPYGASHEHGPQGRRPRRHIRMIAMAADCYQSGQGLPLVAAVAGRVGLYRKAATQARTILSL